VIEDLIEKARAGESVYITDLHRRFGNLPEAGSDALVCVVEPLDGGPARRFDLRVPRLEGLSAEEARFVGDYVQAEVYNILSALGGKRMTLYFDRGRTGLAEVLGALPGAFGIGLGRSARRGYGRAVNVIDRMMGALAPSEEAFSFRFGDIEDAPSPPARPRPKADLAALFRDRAARLGGKAMLGIDVGGTDIKAVLVDDGRLVDYKEYDWFPAGFTRSRQLVDPICAITRLLRARLWLNRLPAGDSRARELSEIAARARAKEAGDAEMEAAISAIEAGGLDGWPAFDGIGLCFPDVVVKDKIVGGEVYKTRGIRNNSAIDYESDFAELTELDSRLRAWVRPGGTVRIINDGPMASFTAAVEIAASDEAGEVAGGVFAHTLGTELGTGWVTESGQIPDMPLEVYNFVVDLGSWPERAYEPDDVRSVNNFNTGLPGTLQKYCSQSGVFRLAMKRFAADRPDLLSELVEKGFLERRRAEGGEGWYVPTYPVDQRKPFLEHMMGLPDREGDDADREIWREIGRSIGATFLETKRILDPGTDERFLFGRLVKNRTCFELMSEGAREVAPGISLVVAGTGLANTPLMKELEGRPPLTVAQFAQAIGAVYFANE